MGLICVIVETIKNKVLLTIALRMLVKKSFNMNFVLKM